MVEGIAIPPLKRLPGSADSNCPIIPGASAAAAGVGFSPPVNPRDAKGPLTWHYSKRVHRAARNVILVLEEETGGKR
jgi:hypothetical protein